MEIQEIWKPIEGYEDLYEISNLGRLRNFKGVIKKPQSNGNGYKKVFLYRDGKGKGFFMHRLVAKAFVPNPENKPNVNHIDESRDNNVASNLEWVTQSENVRHGTSPMRMRQGVIGFWKSHPLHNCKAVRCIETQVVYPSLKAASEATGAQSTNIKKCIKGERHTAGGYSWEFA